MMFSLSETKPEHCDSPKMSFMEGKMETQNMVYIRVTSKNRENDFSILVAEENLPEDYTYQLHLTDKRQRYDHNGNPCDAGMDILDSILIPKAKSILYDVSPTQGYRPKPDERIVFIAILFIDNAEPYEHLCSIMHT